MSARDRGSRITGIWIGGISEARCIDGLHIDHRATISNVPQSSFVWSFLQPSILTLTSHSVSVIEAQHRRCACQIHAIHEDRIDGKAEKTGQKKGQSREITTPYHRIAVAPAARSTLRFPRCLPLLPEIHSLDARFPSIDVLSEWVRRSGHLLAAQTVQRYGDEECLRGKDKRPLERRLQ